MDSKLDHRRNNEEKEIIEICSTQYKYIPIDLTVEILSRLPIKSIGRFISASKSWRDIITSRRFSFTYAKNNPFSMFYTLCPRLHRGHIIEVSENNNNSLATIVQPKGILEIREIVGLCNGLLCLREWRNAFVILNPITNERTAITILDDDHGLGAHNICAEYHGFGYSPSTNEYKLFKGLKVLRGGVLRVECAIFTIGVDERWRKLPPNLFAAYDMGMCDEPVPCNGAFHWLVFWYHNKYLCMHILAFDIATENTQRIPTPHKSRRYLRLLALNERLYLVRSVRSCLSEPAKTFLWRIEDYGVSSSGIHIVWPVDPIHFYSFQAPKLLDCSTKSGKIVFKADTSGHLGLYCPKQMSHDVIRVPYHYDDVNRSYEFTPTFSSIDEIVYGRSRTQHIDAVV